LKKGQSLATEVILNIFFVQAQSEFIDSVAFNAATSVYRPGYFAFWMFCNTLVRIASAFQCYPCICFKGSLEIILHIPLPFLCLTERHIQYWLSSFIASISFSSASFVCMHGPDSSFSLLFSTKFT
jgi:hypothetical protein